MTIYAIPGLGTTKELYVNIELENHTIVILQWPKPAQDQKLKDYAKEFISQINLNEPFCLLGVSFGGMLCVELSKIISPKKLILISTSKTRNELPFFIRLLKYIPLHIMISENKHRRLAYYSRAIIGFEKTYTHEFMNMVNSMQEHYFKRCIHMIVNWDNKTLPKNYLHIHGAADRLIPQSCVSADITIKSGTHAMIVFNAEEINLAIEKVLAEN